MKMDLPLNNLQRLICYKTQTTKQLIKRMDFTPTKFSRVSLLSIKKTGKLFETLMIKLISYLCNSQSNKTKLLQINLAKLLKAKNLSFKRINF